MKRKDSNCVGIISDQWGAETASNLSEYTIHNVSINSKPDHPGGHAFAQLSLPGGSG